MGGSDREAHGGRRLYVCVQIRHHEGCFPNLCEKDYICVLACVCFCCLSCANDSLEGCLGKQTWEGDEEEEGGGVKEGMF